jgi:hypothetical protein
MFVQKNLTGTVKFQTRKDPCPAEVTKDQDLKIYELESTHKNVHFYKKFMAGTKT